MAHHLNRRNEATAPRVTAIFGKCGSKENLSWSMHCAARRDAQPLSATLGEHVKSSELGKVSCISESQART